MEILKEGGFQRNYEDKLYFLEGQGGGSNQNPSVGGVWIFTGIARVTRKRVLEGTQDNAFDSRPAATPDLSESSLC